MYTVVYDRHRRMRSTINHGREARRPEQLPRAPRQIEGRLAHTQPPTARYVTRTSNRCSI